MNYLRQNLETSLILGAVVFAAMFIPGLMWQYWRHGQFSFRRMLGWAAVCVYTTALFVYTLMPLPENGAAWCATHSVRSNFTPFGFINDIQRETVGMSTAQILRSNVVLQVVFNVVLFLPFGAIMHRYFGRGIVFTTLAGLATSTFIEASQYTGIFGIYPCAIRVADVDDLIMNTAGALIGALIAPLLLWWMPSARQLAAKRLAPRRVTAARRWTGMLLDAALFLGIQMGTTVVLFMGRWLLAGSAPVEGASWEPLVAGGVALVVVFVGPALTGRGASAGQKIVWLTPKWISRDGTHLTDGNLALRIARSLVVAGPYVASELVASVSELVASTVTVASATAATSTAAHAATATATTAAISASTLSGVLGLVSTLAVLLAILMVLGSRTHRSLSGWLTGAMFVDSRDPYAGGPDNEAPLPLTDAKKVELGLPV
ncbi:MAG: VanZ family protein [Ancrocorticia sp.]